MNATGTWCKIPLASGDETIIADMEARCVERIANTKLSEQDVQNIRNRKLDLIPKHLMVDPVKLEKLRRLCQLWEVDIRVGEITSHRKFIGPVIVQAKKILFPVIRFILKDLIREQRDFNSASISLFAEICNQSSSEHAHKSGSRHPV